MPDYMLSRGYYSTEPGSEMVNGGGIKTLWQTSHA